MSKKNENLATDKDMQYEPLLCASYSTDAALEISKTYREIKNLFDKFRYISRCSGIKLVIKDKRYWFEFFGKQITETDFYIGKSLKRMLHIACT